jgi:putative transposase
VSEAYRFIAAEKASYPVSLMSRVLGVNRTAFHRAERRPPSERALEDAWLTEQITAIHTRARGVYGARRIHAELRLAHGVKVGKKRVERLMREAGLSGLVKHRRTKTTISVAGVRVADDLVRRDFKPAAPDVLWVADITYLRSWEGFLYLAAVQDAFSRRVVGWSMADHMRAEFVVDALQMALRRRRPAPGLIHHSDQGSQGEFNRSSQLSIERSRDGQEGSGLGACRAAGDEVPGSTAGRKTGASAAVLGGDCARVVERGRRDGGWRVVPGRRPVVSRGWRDADCHPRAAVGTLPVVRRAGGDRASSRPRRQGDGDRTPARSLTIDDLEGTPSQRRDPRRRARIPRHDRSVARR